MMKLRVFARAVEWNIVNGSVWWGEAPDEPARGDTRPTEIEN